MADLAPADWDRVLAINATGTYNCMYAALARDAEAPLGPDREHLVDRRQAGDAAGRAGLRGLEVRRHRARHGGRPGGAGQRHPRDEHLSGEVNTPILAQRPEPVPPEKLAQMVMPEDIAACVVTLAKLPDRVLVPELVITPLYQDYA